MNYMLQGLTLKEKAEFLCYKEHYKQALARKDGSQSKYWLQKMEDLRLKSAMAARPSDNNVLQFKRRQK